MKKKLNINTSKNFERIREKRSIMKINMVSENKNSYRKIICLMIYYSSILKQICKFE